MRNASNEYRAREERRQLSFSSSSSSSSSSSNDRLESFLRSLFFRKGRKAQRFIHFTWCGAGWVGGWVGEEEENHPVFLSLSPHRFVLYYPVCLLSFLSYLPSLLR